MTFQIVGGERENYVLTTKANRNFLLNIFYNIIFILRDTLSQVNLGAPLNMIQYKGYCGSVGNDIVRQYEC